MRWTEEDAAPPKLEEINRDRVPQGFRYGAKDGQQSLLVTTRSECVHLVLVTGFSKGAFVTTNYMRLISILAVCLALVVQAFRVGAEVLRPESYP